MPELPPPPSDRPGWRSRLDHLAPLVAERRARLIAVGGAVACVALAVVAWRAWRPPPVPIEMSLPRASASGDSETSGASAPTTAPDVIVVAAAGAVAAPGVYRLPSGSRVTDLLDAAGGPTDDADLDQLNLAARIGDGDRVYVPRVGEVPPAELASSSGGADSTGAPIDLNTATVDQLDALPGIGPSTAQAIVDFRTEHGRIRSVDELLEVRGIGPAKLEAIRAKVRAGR